MLCRLTLSILFVFVNGAITCEELSIKNIFDFKIVEESSDIKVIISYEDLYAFSIRSISLEDLRNTSNSIQVTLRRSMLPQIVEFLKSIYELNFEVIDGTPLKDVRFCADFYVNGERFFSYAICSFNIGMLINDKWVRTNQIFYDFMNSFLPKKIVQYHQTFIDAAETLKKKAESK